MVVLGPSGAGGGGWVSPLAWHGSGGLDTAADPCYHAGWTATMNCTTLLPLAQPQPVRRLVCDLRRSNPGSSTATIARISRCSRERARQILTQEGLPTQAILPPGPAKRVPPPRTTVTCPECGTARPRRPSEVKRGARFCSRRCMGKEAARLHGFGSQARRHLKRRGVDQTPVLV